MSRTQRACVEIKDVATYQETQFGSSLVLTLHNMTTFSGSLRAQKINVDLNLKFSL